MPQGKHGTGGSSLDKAACACPWAQIHQPPLSLVGISIWESNLNYARTTIYTNSSPSPSNWVVRRARIASSALTTVTSRCASHLWLNIWETYLHQGGVFLALRRILQFGVWSCKSMNGWAGPMTFSFKLFTVLVSQTGITHAWSYLLNHHQWLPTLRASRFEVDLSTFIF